MNIPITFVFLVLAIVGSGEMNNKPSTPLVVRLVRSDLIHDKVKDDYLHENAGGDIISRVIPWYRQPCFLANISVGSPPAPQLLDIDTGSSFLWIQCRPCTECYAQALPVFEPSKSSSFHNVPCSCDTSRRRSSPILIEDTRTGFCNYSQRYTDGSVSRGRMATETLTFQTGDDAPTSISDVVFGCGHDNYGSTHVGSGLIGLGPGRFSLVKRLGSKFSYCFGRLSDRYYPHNVLVLGEGAIIEGDWTQLEILGSNYFISLEAIYFDGVPLPIEGSAFVWSTSNRGNTIIDSGSSMTELVRDAYEPLAKKVESLLEGKFEPATVQGRLCYKKDIEVLNLSGFPLVTFGFVGGTKLSLDVESLFHTYGSTIFCFTIGLNSRFEGNLIGVTAMQNHNIGFDLDAKKVYFQRMDCEVLEL